MHRACRADQFGFDAQYQLQRWLEKSKRIHLSEDHISTPTGDFQTGLFDLKVTMSRFESAVRC